MALTQLRLEALRVNSGTWVSRTAARGCRDRNGTRFRGSRDWSGAQPAPTGGAPCKRRHTGVKNTHLRGQEGPRWGDVFLGQKRSSRLWHSRYTWGIFYGAEQLVSFLNLHLSSNRFFVHIHVSDGFLMTLLILITSFSFSCCYVVDCFMLVLFMTFFSCNLRVGLGLSCCGK